MLSRYTRKILKRRSAMTQSVFYRDHFNRFSASSQLSLLATTSYSTAGHSDYSCLPMRDAGMTNKRLKVETTEAVVFHQNSLFFTRMKTIHFKPIYVINAEEGCVSTRGFMQL